MAATCGWTFVGAALTSIGCKRLHQELVSLQPDIMYPRGSGNGERPEENSERVGLSVRTVNRARRRLGFPSMRRPVAMVMLEG